MKVLFAAGEALPFAATGGLADVAGSLPSAENANGCDTRVVIPLYSDIPEHFRQSFKFITSFYVPVAWRSQYCGLFEAEVDGLKYYLLDNEYYFKRQGIYGHYDDAERFAFFSRAVLELLKHIDFKPDIIHSNDWHTALIPVFHRAFYSSIPEYAGIKTVFTIHNILYQGKYGAELFTDILGLPEWTFPLLEYDGCLNFMKGAIVSSGAVTTVSPTYAQELRYPYFSYGLDRILLDCSYKFSGILNGIDTVGYDPETDSCIFKNYKADDTSGKAENKIGLQHMLGLPHDESAMLIGMVTRLVEPKGIELVKFVLEEMLTDHVQLVILGKGDWHYEKFFCEMQKRYPGKLAVRIGFFQDMARKVYAGSDVLLMPSKTEPCGLSQMVAMRYGTVPIVRETGGLKDSVIDCGSEEGYGYTFQSFNAHDMLGAIRRAEGAFANKPYWKEITTRAMNSDVSWGKSACEYTSLYKRLIEG
jgi:starch synthase